MSFLSTQRVDLDSPGYAKNDIYYDTKEIVVQDCELNTTIGRFNQSLTSLQFGSTSQIIIPNTDMVYEVYLHMTLPAVILDQTITTGWCYDIIREISFTFGQSNVSNLRLSGKSIRQLNVMSSATREKATEMVTVLGGEGHRAVTGVIPEGTICIPLPWSNMSGDKKKPFDMSLLNNPVQLQITLNDGTSIYGGQAASFPTALSSASVFMRTGTLSDKSNSIRQELMNNSSLMYEYPFYHKVSPSPKYGLVTDTTTVNRVELLEFIESDLQTIIFSVHDTPQQKKTVAGLSGPSPGVSLECFDINLEYNGQTIFSCPGNSARLIPMAWDAGASGVIDNYLAPDALYTNIPHTSYAYMIPFGSMKNINFYDKFDNTSRFSSQTLQLSFRCTGLTGLTGARSGELHATYVYSAAAAIQAGVANIQFS